MRDDFEKYIQSMGLSATLSDKVRAIHDIYQLISPQKTDWIFISDYITQEGDRMFGSLWFLAERYVMEAKEFGSQDDYDLALLQLPLLYVRIRKQDFDSKIANEKSRMFLSFTAHTNMSGEMKASKENCDHLWRLFCEYFVPRMK